MSPSNEQRRGFDVYKYKCLKFATGPVQKTMVESRAQAAERVYFIDRWDILNVQRVAIVVNVDEQHGLSMTVSLWETLSHFELVKEYLMRAICDMFGWKGSAIHIRILLCYKNHCIALSWYWAIAVKWSTDTVAFINTTTHIVDQSESALSCNMLQKLHVYSILSEL